MQSRDSTMFMFQLHFLILAFWSYMTVDFVVALPPTTNSVLTSSSTSFSPNSEPLAVPSAAPSTASRSANSVLRPFTENSHVPDIENAKARLLRTYSQIKKRKRRKKGGKFKKHTGKSSLRYYKKRKGETQLNANNVKSCKSTDKGKEIKTIVIGSLVRGSFSRNASQALE
jgi:hypothetical protein